MPSFLPFPQPGIPEAADCHGVCFFFFFFTMDLLGNCYSLVPTYHFSGVPFGRVSDDLGKFLALLSVSAIWRW